MVGEVLRFKSISRGQAPLDGYAGVRWSLPSRGEPGPWMPDVLPLVPFTSGYHLHAAPQLIDHELTGGPRVWLAEGRGISLDVPGRFAVFESARLVRELDWSHRTRLRVALATARDVLAFAGGVAPFLPAALDEADRLTAPSPESLREIEVRLLQPNRPVGLTHWEEELEDDPAGRRRRRAEFDRYMTVSWALAAEPPSALTYGRGAVGGGAFATRIERAYDARVWAALFRGEVPASLAIDRVRLSR